MLYCMSWLFLDNHDSLATDNWYSTIFHIQTNNNRNIKCYPTSTIPFVSLFLANYMFLSWYWGYPCFQCSKIFPRFYVIKNVKKMLHKTFFGRVIQKTYTQHFIALPWTEDFSLNPFGCFVCLYRLVSLEKDTPPKFYYQIDILNDLKLKTYLNTLSSPQMNVSYGISIILPYVSEWIVCMYSFMISSPREMFEGVN